jgi:hypothetical protein
MFFFQALLLTLIQALVLMLMDQALQVTARQRQQQAVHHLCMLGVLLLS